MENDYVELLEAAIEENDLTQTWRAGLFNSTEEGEQKRAEVRFRSSKNDLVAFMWSQKNDGAHACLNWPIGAAVGIAQTTAKYRKALNGSINNPYMA